MSVYVALDGPDGSGKSTQAARLVAALRDRGLDVVHLREPGSTAFGERLRQALLDPDVGGLDPLSEALAFSAARRETMRKEIAPALAHGRVVITERCFLSTVVYQCRAPARDAAPEALIRDVTAAALGGVWPDLILVLHADADTVKARLEGVRAPDRIESLGSEFHERVRRGFVDLTEPGSWLHDALRRPSDRAEDPPRIVLVDAGRDLDRVHEAVLRAVGQRLDSRRGAR